MAEKASKSDEKLTATAESASALEGTSIEGALDPLKWLGSAWLQNWSAVSSEVSHFVAERIREDVKTQHQILNCKNLGDLNAVQTQFIQTAIDQYTAETGKLAEMGQEFVDRLSQKKPN